MKIIIALAVVMYSLVLIGEKEEKPELIHPVYAETERETVLIEVKYRLKDKLKPICACESLGDKNASPAHFDAKGDVLRGRIDPDDIGMCQINERYHGKQAKKLGLDIHTEQGNIRYANWLYEKEGNTPWLASKRCWQ